MTKDLKKLQSSPPEHFLNKAVECHLRMSSVAQKNKDKCKLCTVHDNIEVYEHVIFHFVRGEVKAMKGHVRETLTSEENKKLEEVSKSAKFRFLRSIYSVKNYLDRFENGCVLKILD